MKFHLALPVQDLERSKVFYERIGFQFVRQFEKPEQQLQFVQLRYAEQYWLELVYHPANRPFTATFKPETLHFGLEVADLEGMMGTLEAAGVKVLRDVTPGVSVRRFAFVADPDGYPIELVEPQ